MKHYLPTGLLIILYSLFFSPARAQEPWVRNASRPFDIEQGLDGRHVSVWASHGRYYDQKEGRWQWQRPALFGTTEDLFTQTIVVPYLIPMLENAGAVVFTPRERDWQRHEVIVDNDSRPTFTAYRELSLRHAWTEAPQPGFALHAGSYRDGENPFEAGTARQCETTRSKNRHSTISYQPTIPETGRYAVYVSYQTTDRSIDDARYTVWHQGQATEFRVNQQMGGSTWVYLGTFCFDAGSSDRNRVELSNQSCNKGVVTADAVRFGGGMGNIERGGTTSRLPRCLEGARYYAQWAGMPYSVYSSKAGQNDYADDINVRSLMTNELCGGSIYAPDSAGRHVPIELTLAVHSDAGHTDTGLGVYGSLAICTTQKGDSLLGNSRSRQLSYDLASQLLDNVTRDLQQRYGQWEARALYDRNYSETRLPVVPSAILETLSHQNFGDMRYAQDPTFRFTLARSVYKTLLRYIARQHRQQPVVQPLPPEGFHIEFTQKRGEVRLSWLGTTDPQEPTAAPTGYVLYMAMGDDGYDNGTHLRGTTCSVRLMPNVLYRFRVCATNDGGQSFPTEELTALYDPSARHTILVVNGFSRLSSPAIAASGQGFDLQEDIGVSYGRTAGWLGMQRVFDERRLGVVDSTGLGFTTNELEGRFIAGNTFDYVRTHAQAMARAGHYSILSASAQAVESGDMELQGIAAIDLILGLQRNDGHSLQPYRTFTPPMQERLRAFARSGGRLMVSGAYVGSDMTGDSDRAFLADVLKVECTGANREADNSISGMGLSFGFHRQYNEQHYAAPCTDVLMPAHISVGGDLQSPTSAGGDLQSPTSVGGDLQSPTAFPAMVYANQTSAAVAYQGKDYRAFTMGFPFECITDGNTRQAIMAAIVKFLLE